MLTSVNTVQEGQVENNELHMLAWLDIQDIVQACPEEVECQAGADVAVVRRYQLH